MVFFFFLSQVDKNSGCYGNLQLPLTYNGGKWKFAFIAISMQIFWQKFYRNVPWVVTHQTYAFLSKPHGNQKAKFEKKKYSEIISSEAIMGWSWNFA